jgi:hypothetical protein
VKHADYAWLALAAGVVTYERYAPPGQLLSEAMDRYRASHPIIARAAVCYLALHLLRAIPRRVDPLHRVATWR